MRRRVVVLGAGVTGLSAAYRLSLHSDQFDVHVLDRSIRPGGLCQSFTEGEFILDHGPHKFYSLVDGITESLQEILSGELLEREKIQKLYFGGKYYAFPLKMSEMLLRFPPHKSVQFVSSLFLQTLKNFIKEEDSHTYEQFVIERFGRGLYQQLFEPLAQKIYGDPKSLDRKLAEVRISSPGLWAVIKQALFSRVDRKISAPSFHYPKEGYGRIPQRLYEIAKKNGVHFHMGTKILQIKQRNQRVTSVLFEDSQGLRQEIACEAVIYSIPPTHLPALLENPEPKFVQACEGLSFRHTIIYYYLLKSEPILPAMWIFFPESKFRFGRLSEMSQFSPHTVPQGHTALMVDFTCEEEDPFWAMQDDALGDVLQKQLTPLRLFQQKSVLKRFSKRFRNVYPKYSLGYQKHLETIRSLENHWQNLFFVGRLGDFNYNNADQCLDMGFQVADHLLRGQGGEIPWPELRRKRFEKYRIVD